MCVCVLASLAPNERQGKRGPKKVIYSIQFQLDETKLNWTKCVHLCLDGLLEPESKLKLYHSGNVACTFPARGCCAPELMLQRQ